MKLEEIIKECGFTRIDGDAGIEITNNGSIANMLIARSINLFQN